MIHGVHALIYSKDAVRAFFRDVPGFRTVDSGGGWLLFELPPAELGIHPAEVGSHQLHLMCDNLQSTIAELERKGVKIARPVEDRGYGRVTAIALPDGTELGLYEPRHPLAVKPAIERTK